MFAAGLVATAAAAIGWFRVAAPLLWLAIMVLVALLAARWRMAVLAWEVDRYDIAAVALAALFALGAILFHHHQIHAETDAGFYANDAWIIASTGGRFLDGAYDGTLPAFDATPSGNRYAAMFGYTSLAALIAWVGGPDAATWVNLPLLVVTFLCVYLLGRRMDAKWGGLFALVFYGTSLVTLWMSRYTVTEMAASAIFWLAVLAAWPLASRWEPWRATSLVVALAWGSLVRPEGLAVAAGFAVVLIVLRRRSLAPLLRRPAKAWAGMRASPERAFAGSVAVSLLIVGLVLFSDAAPSNYLRSSFELASSVLEGRPAADNPHVPVDADQVPAQSPTNVDPPPMRTWGDYALRYEWDSIREYYLPWFLAIGLVGIALRLVNWRHAVLLFAFVLPYAVFLLMPPVTTQQPWFMRRLWIAWLPAVYLLAGVALDPRNAAWRWPVRRKRTTMGRPDAAIVAAIVGLVILVPHLALSLPVVDDRASDGLDTLLPALQRVLPKGAVVIVDEDLAGISTPLRVRTGMTVVTWHTEPTRSFIDSLRAADELGRAYIVRANFTRPVPVLETDVGGSTIVDEFNYERADIPTGGLLSYLSNPPLAHGYEPLQQYLEFVLPPQIAIAQLRASVLEAEMPLVIQKNIKFNESEWIRTPEGLLAVADGASLDFNATQFVGGRGFILHVAYPQLSNRTITLQVQNAFGLADLSPPLASDGSGALRMERLHIPPLPSTIECPNGTVLRGIYVGLA